MRFLTLNCKSSDVKVLDVSFSNTSSHLDTNRIAMLHSLLIQRQSKFTPAKHDGDNINEILVSLQPPG